MRLFAVLLLVPSVLAFYYSNTDLDDYCSYTTPTFQASCPTTYFGTAGVATFSTPSRNCTVEFTITTSCIVPGTFAIYFNIRDVDIPVGDSIVITENVGLSTYTVKTISGRRLAQHRDPTSAGQLLSRYQFRPSLSITYKRNNKNYDSGKVVFDYNIIYKESTTENTWCSALDGYVHDDLICDGYDRVNCPDSYTAMTTMGNWADDYQSCGLSDGAIVGVVLGVVAGVALTTIITVLACRSSRNRTTRVQHQAFTANPYGTTVTVTGAVGQPVSTVSGQYQPSPYPTQAYYGAPPPYYTVQTSATTTSPAPYPAGSVAVTQSN